MLHAHHWKSLDFLTLVSSLVWACETYLGHLMSFFLTYTRRITHVSKEVQVVLKLRRQNDPTGSHVKASSHVCRETSQM